MHQNLHSKTLEFNLRREGYLSTAGLQIGFQAKGALLPSVGGCAALQPDAALLPQTLREEINIQMPRTDRICQWQVAFHIMPTTLASP